MASGLTAFSAMAYCGYIADAVRFDKSMSPRPLSNPNECVLFVPQAKQIVYDFMNIYPNHTLFHP